jgi:D-serine deaminase-like pyridoxal phosphate-dependent protein
VETLDTPSLIIDADKLRANLRSMAEIASANGVKLRPHAKTHKIPRIARMQLEYGACGITVATVSEAEVMARGGIDDIFIAYPLVSPLKLERAVRLASDVRLSVGVDSMEGARRLAEAARRHGVELNVRLEVDTGLARTGAAYEEALPLARAIHGLPPLKLTGLYTFRGALLGGKPTLDRKSAGIEEGRMMAELAERMRAEGLPAAEVSVGSTPTAAYAASVPGVTEIRPGTYVFQDRMQAAFGVCGLDDCAAVVLATVVSCPAEDRFVIDGGSKTFATDAAPGKEPLFLEGFGHIVEVPGAVLERLSEEHGMVRSPGPHGLSVGDTVRIIPNHICSTVNLHNFVYLADGGRMERLEVAARGMVQ